MDERMAKLAVAQTLMRVAGDVCSTKDPDSLRSQLDADMLANYDSMGVKSIDLKMNGEKVGTYSVRVSKAKDTPYLAVTDEEEFREWAEENGYMRWEVDTDAVLRDFQLTGELPGGADVQVRHDPERATGTTLKVEPAKVAHALKGDLPATIAGLLQEGGK